MDPRALAPVLRAPPPGAAAERSVGLVPRARHAPRLLLVVAPRGCSWHRPQFANAQPEAEKTFSRRSDGVTEPEPLPRALVSKASGRLAGCRGSFLPSPHPRQNFHAVEIDPNCPFPILGIVLEFLWGAVLCWAGRSATSWRRSRPHLGSVLLESVRSRFQEVPGSCSALGLRSVWGHKPNRVCACPQGAHSPPGHQAASG